MKFTPSPIPNYLTNLIAILIIIFFGVSLLVVLPNYLDVTFYDESNYMYRGVHLGIIYVEPENGPLYSVWYYLLHFFEANSLNLYYLNWIVTTILPSVTLFLALRAYNVNIALSFIFSIFLLYTQLNVTNWPRVSNFCISAMLVSLIIYRNNNNNFYKFYTLSLSTFAISYIRPEFFISFLLAVIPAVFYLLKAENRTNTVNYILILFLIGLIITTKLTYGLPMFEQSSFRSVVAFAQYYTMNKFIKENIWPEDPWTNWEKYFYPIFGQAESMLASLEITQKIFTIK